MKLPYQNEVARLASALAEKGGPGMALLGMMFVVFWSLPILFTSLYFSFLPRSAVQEPSVFPVTYLLAGLLVLIALTTFAYGLSKETFSSMVPTLRADAEVSDMMSEAFGGKVVTVAGDIAIARLSREVAKSRIYKIMKALVARATQVLEVSDLEHVRSNIFATPDNQWLSIVDGLHVNMKNDRERSIQVLNGYLSSGTAFKYFLPVISLAHEEGTGVRWDHQLEPETFQKQVLRDDILEKQEEELGKADKKLRWILSMPIPYQVSPFRMACGVLNLDGFSAKLYRDQVKKLLADAAVAAALIGVMNKATDVLTGQCNRPESIPKDVAGIKDARLRAEFLIEANEFDPAECPEPSEKFRELLAGIKGLEFFRNATTTDVAEFIRKQL